MEFLLFRLLELSVVLNFNHSKSTNIEYYHSFSGPNVCLARLQMELCRAANIFAAHQNQKSAFWGFVEIFGL